MELTAKTFEKEIEEAIRTYEKYIVCIDKVPEDCRESLNSLIDKAIKAYINRAAGLRHGIALDKQITIILSQSEEERPMCSIYFNLFSPYKKRISPTKSK